MTRVADTVANYPKSAHMGSNKKTFRKEKEMKGKRLLWAFLPLSAAMILASCTEPVESSSQPSSSESSSVKETITHRTSLNKTLADGAVTRNYDERFDTVVEDFSGEKLLGTSDGTSHNAYLREIVDSNLESFQTTPDGAIYKMANATFGGDKTILGQSTINFTMRVAAGKLSIKDLILGIRPSDDNNAHVYPISLGDAVNDDLEKLDELSSEFKTFSISIGQSIEDENVTFPDTKLKVLSEAIGFHLYCKTGIEVSAVIEISEVSYSKGEATTVIDEFARKSIGGNDRVYWGPTDCADAVLVRKGVLLPKDKKYVTPTLSEKQRAYSHIVIDALGDLSGTSVEVAYDDTAATVKTLAFSALKAKTDKTVVNAVDGAYSPLAVDLGVFGGPADANIKTVTIKNTADKEVEIANIFMTNFEEPALDKKYPNINTSNAVTFDNFNRDITSLNDNWDASAADERNVKAGINGFVSRKNGENISTSNGALHLPANKDDYSEVTIGSQHYSNDAQYIVFSIKGEEGFDLSSFRFEMGDQATAIWFNAAQAMEGVKTYGDATYPSPYVMENGYTWYVIDLTLCKDSVKSRDLIHIYYTGEKAIDIDSIFYADSFSVGKIRDGWAESTEIDLANYKYAGNVGPAYDGKYVGFTVKGDGTATLVSFRFERGGTALWLKDGAIDVYNAAGKKVTKDEVIPEVATTYYADIATAKFPKENDGSTHVHVGGAEEATGKVTFENIFLAGGGYAFAAHGANEVNGNKGYAYCGGWTATAHTDRIYVHVSGNDKSDLNEFRVEVNKVVVFAKDNANLLKNIDGSAVDLTKKVGTSGKDADDNGFDNSVNLIIDLKAAGIAAEKGQEVHFHNSSNEENWTLKFDAATAYSESYPYTVALASYNQNWN